MQKIMVKRIRVWLQHVSITEKQYVEVGLTSHGDGEYNGESSDRF